MNRKFIVPVLLKLPQVSLHVGMDVGEDVGVVNGWQDMTMEHEGVAEGGVLALVSLKELLEIGSKTHHRMKVS